MRKEVDNGDQWRDAQNNVFTLCIVHELAANCETTSQASIVFGGYSLCREHFELITNSIHDFYTDEDKRIGLTLEELLSPMFIALCRNNKFVAR